MLQCFNSYEQSANLMSNLKIKLSNYIFPLSINFSWVNFRYLHPDSIWFHEKNKIKSASTFVIHNANYLTNWKFNCFKNRPPKKMTLLYNANFKPRFALYRNMCYCSNLQNSAAFQGIIICYTKVWNSCHLI